MQNRKQLSALLGFNARANARLLHHRSGEGLREKCFALLRQIQCPSSPIRGVGTSLKQRPSLEMVNNCHHRARRDRQMITDGLLQLTLELLDGVQDGKMSGLEAKRTDHFAELARGLKSNLREGEAHRVPGHRHPGSVIQRILFVRSRGHVQYRTLSNDSW
jgi:hypothetical protein